MDSNTQQTQQTQQTRSGTGGGDMLDKGVEFAGKQAGYETSHSTTEKLSDGVRAGYKQATGNDVPVQDKQYS